MPLEIRELVIKTTIEQDTQQRNQGYQSIDFAAFKERVIEECIERTLEIIERREER